MTPPTSKSGFILSIVITSGFIFQPLQVHHAAVLGAAGVQLIVGANGLNLAIIQEDDLVQPLHRGNAVGNQQGGLVGAAGFQVVQNDFSVRVSTAETESSRIRMGASFSRARAMEMRCFWPPETVTPRSPRTVS